RHERIPQALRARLLAQVGEHVVKPLGVQLLFRRDTFVMHPLADFCADRLGFRRNFEIKHGISSSGSSCKFLMSWLAEWHNAARTPQQWKHSLKPCTTPPRSSPARRPDGPTPPRAVVPPACAAAARRSCASTVCRPRL